VGLEAGSSRLGQRWPAHSCREQERRAAAGARSMGGESGAEAETEAVAGRMKRMRRKEKIGGKENERKKIERIFLKK